MCVASYGVSTKFPLVAVASSSAAIATTTHLIGDWNGNVGVGTTSPFTNFAVNGDGYFDGNITANYFTATSTALTSSLGRLLVNSSTTLQNFTFINATGTSATTTSFFSTTASSTNLYAQTAQLGSLLLGASTTLQDLTFRYATGTSATTTNFFATTASSTNLYASLGAVGGPSGLNIISGGKVGIGSSTPAQLLSISGGNILHIASSSPTLASSTDLTGGSALGVVIQGRFAYIAGFNTGHGLKIVDINDPYSPVLLKIYTTAGSTWGVSTAGRYAYLAEDTSGLEIVDVSNPNAPVRVSLTGLPSGAALGVAVAGKYAYVAGGSGGLHVFDVSNPQAPALIGTRSFTNAKYVTVSGGYAAATNPPPRTLEMCLRTMFSS